MTKASNTDPFEQFEKADQEMKTIQDKIRQLCNTGQYDQAQLITDEELIPALEKWRKSLKYFLSGMKIDRK